MTSSPDNFGWKLKNNKRLPEMTTLPPSRVNFAVRKRDVRPTDANAVKQISSPIFNSDCIPARV